MMLPLEGKVAEVVNGGFRVLIKGKLAFCPISQMDTKRIETPDEYLGRKLEFRITKFEEGGRNIVVSRRKLLDEQAADSAGSFASEKKAGDIVRGRVARLEKFGAFIELAPGIDGLAHISELAWSRVNDPAEVLTVGQEVSAKILKIETAPDPRGGASRMRVSLSIKQAGAEPWDNLPGELRAGQVVPGKVTRLAKFGAFVELTPGIEGLVPLSEMSYTQRVMSADEIVKEGEQILVMIKDVNPETKRVGLSIKDAGSDPWALVAQKFPVGGIFQGKVTRREGYGLFVQLEDGITGLLPKTKASEEFPFDKVKINDLITVQVAEIRREERRISLQPPGDPSADDWKGYVAPAASSGGGFGTLGDKLKAALDPKKK
jgi:small subunit ribosomal protein S1